MGNLQNQSIAQKYFERFGFRDQIIEAKPPEDLGIIVVIPSYKEDQLKQSIESIQKCERPNCAVEIITVINASESDELNLKVKHLVTFEELEKENFEIPVYPILENELPKKHAGVGLARKIGMDEATRRFAAIERNGVIACFDADSFCDSNYLQVLEEQFLKSESNGCSIYFEHPLEGEEHPKECYQGIINYELFLRFYNLAQKFAGLPFAYHTVGSSMAVKPISYMQQGGMNKRKAGEDFYFLQKIIQTGKFSELNSTKVIPSPRTSDRVPFGTGKAINDWIQQDSDIYETYDFQVFEEVKTFVEQIPIWCKKDFDYNQLPQNLIPFFQDDFLDQKILEIKKNTTSEATFINRFLVYFDAFKMLKLVHWYRDEVKMNQPLLDMVNQLAMKYLKCDPFSTEKEALLALRIIERKQVI